MTTIDYSNLKLTLFFICLCFHGIPVMILQFINFIENEMYRQKYVS